jgi:hypothetical protein
LAIVAVFAIGYGKLVWRNRLVKREEGKDEEERIKVEELRQSGQMIELRKGQDIPFGVRAIQSGIQVDGIWQSKDSTPIPASLKFGHMRNSSSSISGSQSPSSPSLDVSQAASSRGRSSCRPNESGIFPLDQPGLEDFKAAETQDTRGYRSLYKPRRSSHLRYGSHGETTYNEDTVDQLEGKAVQEQEHSQRPGGTQSTEVEGVALQGAAADNERSSGSETDVTLSNKHAQPRFHRQSLPIQHFGGKLLPEQIKGPLSRSLRASLLSRSSNAEYFAVTLEPPEQEKPDLFVSQLSGPMEVALSPFRPPYAQTAGELTASGESQVPLLSISRVPSPFIPGELHMNKTARKVNSGFEVLPAGTFGVLPDTKVKRVDREEQWKHDEDPGEKRYSNKLQRKIRTSMSSQRRYSAFESP